MGVALICALREHFYGGKFLDSREIATKNFFHGFQDQRVG